MAHQTNLKSIIESLVFVAGKPISIKKLAQITHVPEADILRSLAELKEDYQNRGIDILTRGEEVQMVSSPENALYTKKLLTEELQEDLSRAALETLAIIAYKGPISRHEIEEIRGVNSVYILRNLLIRGLIDRQRSKKDSLSWEYQVSFNFLRHLGIKDIKELPEYEELRKKVNKIEHAQ